MKSELPEILSWIMRLSRSLLIFFFFDSEKEESENKMKKARLKNNSIKKMLGRSKSEGINFESCE